MKAIVQDRYGPADVLELRDVDPPEIGDGEVLVRVRAAGVDPGVWHLMTGFPYLVRIFGYGFRAPKNPVRGSDIAGVVERVGRDVTRFRPGDEVFGACGAGFAELAAATEANLVTKPRDVPFETAAAVPTSAITALQAVRDHGRIRAGQRALVIGAAGGVGSFAVQLAGTFGAEVTGVCSTTKVDLVRWIGAADVIDYTREDFADTGRRWDMIVDTAGNRPLSQLRRALTPDGTLVIVGGERGGRWLAGTDRQLRAMVLSRFVGQRLTSFIAAFATEDLELLAGLVADGALVPVVGRTYPLAEAADAIRDLEHGRARGKLVLVV